MVQNGLISASVAALVPVCIASRSMVQTPGGILRAAALVGLAYLLQRLAAWYEEETKRRERAKIESEIWRFER